MRFVIVAPYYYPYQNPRAYRWTQVSRWLSDQGHHVTIITSSDQPYNAPDNNIKVVQTGFSTPDKRWLRNKGAARRFPGKSLLKNIYRGFIWPDESASWIKDGQKALEKVLTTSVPDVVISVAHPFSSHCVVYPFSKENPFQWWLDIGDPFLLHTSAPRNNAFLWNKRNKAMEQSIFRAADKICITNDRLKEKYQELYPKASSKFHTIGPMRSPESTTISAGSESSTSIQLGYFGTFYQGIRSPKILSEFRKYINSTHDLQWNFFGEIKQRDKDEIIEMLSVFKDKVTFHKPIERSRVLDTMNRMDYLINVSNQTQYQLPSKLVDYLASHRPILNISKTKNTNSEDFLGPYPGIYFWSLSQPISISIENNHSNVERKVDKYTPGKVSQSYLDLFYSD